MRAEDELETALREKGWLDRIGLSRDLGPGDTRYSMRIVVVLLAFYLLSFALFYPTIPTNDDEATYLRQTILVSEGRATVDKIHPISGAVWTFWPSTYSLGTALTMAPFVMLAGPQAAWVVPALSLALGTLLLALWLRQEGRSPIFALLLLGFPPAMVMGRIAMSDVPSTAYVVVGLWLFFRGIDSKSPYWWLGSGFVAGSSLIIRVSNPLLFVPLFAGTVLRREWRCWALVVGGLVGLSLSPLTQLAYFGSATFERNVYQFALDTVHVRLGFYALGLLVFIPGGLILSGLYKGRRRPEIVTTILLFFTFYLLQRFSTHATGFAKRIVLATRYMIPLVPLIAFAMAEVVPRLWRQWLTRVPEARVSAWQRRGTAAVALYLVLIALAATAVHPLFSLWSATQAEIRSAIRTHVPNDSVLVTNFMATRKFIPELDRHFATLDTELLRPEQVDSLVRKHGEVQLVVLDRTDSDYWRRKNMEAAVFVRRIKGQRQLVFDEQLSATDRLRIWKMVREP